MFGGLGEQRLAIALDPPVGDRGVGPEIVESPLALGANDLPTARLVDFRMLDERDDQLREVVLEERVVEFAVAVALVVGAHVRVGVGLDREVVLGEYDRQESSPFFGFLNDMTRKLYPGHFSRKNVIGDRQVSQLEHFSRAKRWLQMFGSWVVRQASGIDVPDTVSGFRAYSREAALRLFVTSRFSYTVQTLIQAGKIGIATTSAPITAQPTTRPSRLHRGSAHFIFRQTLILLQTYTIYEPLKTFSVAATPFFLTGVILLARLLFRFA